MPAVQSRLSFGGRGSPVDPCNFVRQKTEWVHRQELLHNDRKPVLPLQMLMVCAGIDSPGRALTEYGAQVGNESWSKKSINT